MLLRNQVNGSAGFMKRINIFILPAKDCEVHAVHVYMSICCCPRGASWGHWNFGPHFLSLWTLNLLGRPFYWNLSGGGCRGGPNLITCRKVGECARQRPRPTRLNPRLSSTCWPLTDSTRPLLVAHISKQMHNTPLNILGIPFCPCPCSGTQRCTYWVITCGF